MNIRISRWFAAGIFALLAFASTAHAELAVGRDYVAIEPALATDDPSKIEVIEFFSYACPHCSDLAPEIGKWAAKLPPDVTFQHIPVGFGNPFYQNMARLYYALDALGESPRLDAAVFSALHVKGLKLLDEKSIAEWVSAQGIDAKRFSDAYNAFSVMGKTKRADQLAQAAKIRGVPALVVDGRYVVVGQNVKSHAELLALTDKIIDKRRVERRKK